MRITFRWHDGDAYDVRTEDYHRRRQRLPDIHPNKLPPLSLLIGGKIDVADVCHGSGVKARIVVRLSNEEAAIDATIDLRLARYFGMSESFFLDLLQDYDLEEARAHRDVPERIVRRAAR